MLARNETASSMSVYDAPAIAELVLGTHVGIPVTVVT
jgi:hypothetical protein